MSYESDSDTAASRVGIDISQSDFNTERDAFRHAYTSAVVAQESGETIARVLGDANEFFSSSSDYGGSVDPEKDHYMDKWNNEVGIKIGSKVDTLIDSGDIKESQRESATALFVKDAIDEGVLIIDSTDDERIPNEPDWTDIDPGDVPEITNTPKSITNLIELNSEDNDFTQIGDHEDVGFAMAIYFEGVLEWLDITLVTFLPAVDDMVATRDEAWGVADDISASISALNSYTGTNGSSTILTQVQEIGELLVVIATDLGNEIQHAIVSTILGGGFDPIVIDLEGDGIETVSISENNKFDWDADGLKEKTGWLGSNDGFLAVDFNGNGKIDSGIEMFGNNTQGESYQDGFQALSDYDSNGDGVIDSSDSIFDELIVWVDKNQNSHSEKMELYSLADLEIETIFLAAEDASDVNNGNLIALYGEFSFENGNIGIIGDVFFQAEIPML